MRYRKLGKSDIAVSEVSLGCWTMGGLNWSEGRPNGWANVDEPEVRKAIDYALDHGVNHFDNADVYGNGKAECMLARILGERSKNVVIATKLGHNRGTAPHAYQALHVRHQCEQSLSNLQRECIDIYYFHHGDFGPQDQYLDEAIAVMQKLKKEGKIRLIGQSAYSIQDFQRLVPKVKPDVLQSWAHMMDDQYIRPGSVVDTLLRENNMSFIAFSPLAQGVLLGKYKPGHQTSFQEGDHRKNSSSFSDENLIKLAPKLEALKARFGDSPADLARVAIQFLMGHPRVACAIPGFRNLEQVKMNLAAAEPPLSPADLEFVRSVFKA
jgi:aryl-alcohol dehydrogenase-like predicted oxidoreductase